MGGGIEEPQPRSWHSTPVMARGALAGVICCVVFLAHPNRHRRSTFRACRSVEVSAKIKAAVFAMRRTDRFFEPSFHFSCHPAATVHGRDKQHDRNTDEYQHDRSVKNRLAVAPKENGQDNSYTENQDEKQCWQPELEAIPLVSSFGLLDVIPPIVCPIT